MSLKDLTLNRIDAQFVGGYYMPVKDLLYDFPGLKKRWTLDQLREMYECLGFLEAEGFRKKKCLEILDEYLDIRGEEGDLCNCIGYQTSEYCVVLYLMRQAEYREKRMGKRVNTKTETTTES